MFYKTSSHIRQLISPSKNKCAHKEDQWPQNTKGQEKDPITSSLISQCRKSVDEIIFRGTNSKLIAKTSPLPPNLPSAQHSSSFLGDSLCNSPTEVQPHSSSKLDTDGGTLNHLCLRTSIPSTSEVTALPSRKSVNEISKTTPTSQIDLLEALALEPIHSSDETSQREFLTVAGLKSNEAVKGTLRTIRHTSQPIAAPEFILNNRLTAGQVSHRRQDSTEFITKMYPRIEPRRQYRASVPSTATLIKTRNVPYEGLVHISSPKIAPISTTPSNSSLGLAETGKRLSDVSPQEHAEHVNVAGESELDSIRHLQIEDVDELNIRQPYKMSRPDTGTWSIGSTTNDPFHLEGLPWRLKLAEDLVRGNFLLKSLEFRCSTTSTGTSRGVFHTSNLDQPSNSREVGKAQFRSVGEHETVLKSTNFSLTSPGYKHGDIRVRRNSQTDKSSRTISTGSQSPDASRPNTNEVESSTSLSRDQRRLADSPLDLQEFQNAICGTTDYSWTNEWENCFNDNPHPMHETLEVKLDELVKWCNDLGIAMGKMVGGHHERETEFQRSYRTKLKQRQVSAESVAENTFSGIGLLGGGLYEKSHMGRVDEKILGDPLYETVGRMREVGLEDGEDEIAKVVDCGDALLSPGPMEKNIGSGDFERQKSFGKVGFNIDYDLRTI